MQVARSPRKALPLCLLGPLIAGCPPSGEGPPTAREAAELLAEAEQTLLVRHIDESRHGWVQSTFITHDTEILNAEANERYIGAAVDLAKRSRRYADLELPEEQRRKLDLLRLALSLPAPDDPELSGEPTRIAAGMESTYGRGESCGEDGECRDPGQLSRLFATSRDPAELERAWAGWRTISPPMRPQYERYNPDWWELRQRYQGIAPPVEEGRIRGW